MDRIIEEKQLQIERKSFHLELRENERGQFLRITEESPGRRNTVIVPGTGLTEFATAIGTIATSGGEAEAPASASLA